MQPLAGLVLDMFDDLDRVTAGLPESDALARPGRQSAIAWTLNHVIGTADFLINARIRGLELHPDVARRREQFGVSGDADDWGGIQRTARQVRDSLETYLLSASADDLEQVRFPATGHWPEVPLRYVLTRTVAHGYFHVGEIASRRTALGHAVGDFPGPLARSM